MKFRDLNQGPKGLVTFKDSLGQCEFDGSGASQGDFFEISGTPGAKLVM